MSYALFGKDGSDVCVYRKIDGTYACAGCIRTERCSEHYEPNASSMIRHLESHKLEGDKVPESCFNQLLKDTE